jgi:hypothetical protein
VGQELQPVDIGCDRESDVEQVCHDIDEDQGEGERVAPAVVHEREPHHGQRGNRVEEVQVEHGPRGRERDQVVQRRVQVEAARIQAPRPIVHDRVEQEVEHHDEEEEVGGDE